MTPFRCRAVRVFAVLFLLASLSVALRAQSNDARITGIVTDPSKAVIRGAKVDLINVDTGVRYPTVTNGAGIYAVSGQVGNYRLEVEHIGFKTVIAPGIVLHTQDVLEINFEMAVGSASESVTVNAGATNDSPAVSMVVSREFVENMPLNGRSFQDLIQLAPGTVSAANGSGYYSINGQRTDSNNYTVDGVSANLGGTLNSAGPTQGAGLSGSSPSQTVLGTTQSLASVDSLEEFKIQTSGYTAEYGRSPGGQVQVTTRSGSNDIHGTLFDYLRNTVFDANSYHNDYYNDPKTAEHQNDFGGTVGGPLIIPKLYNGKNKTFYFFSYEGLRLLLPASETEYVPTQAFRDWASPNVRPILNSSPLPNPNSIGNMDGCTITDPTTGQPTACDALFTYGYSYPEQLDNISVRVDQNLGKRFHAFIRFADTPSSQTTGAETVETESINNHSWTAGLTANVTGTILNDFRFNSTQDNEHNVQSIRPIGGSVPMPRSVVIPPAYDNAYANGEALVTLSGTSLDSEARYFGVGSNLHQIQAVDGLAWTKASHLLKFGEDWRRVASSYTNEPYSGDIFIESLANVQNGYGTFVYISATNPGAPVFDNLSLYVQDHWKINSRFNLDYGLRWEFNPPPGPSNGNYPAVLSSSNVTTATLAPSGTPPYKTTYNHFAPRFGFTWNALSSQSHPITVRGGFGIFYDTGQTVIGTAYAAAYPFTASRPTQTQVPLPLSETASAPPALNFPLVAPYSNNIYPADPDQTLPYTEQWNLSVDSALNASNTLTASYIGNNGRKLLYTRHYLSGPGGNPNFPQGLNFTYNGSQSSYNALQIQDTGRIASGLDLVGSFTWAHALDDASNDYSQYSPMWGNSDNDLRRVLNLALNYRTRAVNSNRWLRGLTAGWLLASRFSTQSGYPVSLSQGATVLPDGSRAYYLPDLVPNTPIYLHGRDADVGGKPVPGSWRLNRAAFACVPTNETTPCLGTPTRQGTLGRNYVRNPSFYALNTALQRSFPIHEQLHLDFRVEAFNILNHPNLYGPTVSLTASTFGQLVNGLNTTIGSSNALYAMGAARSLQFSLKLRF